VERLLVESHRSLLCTSTTVGPPFPLVLSLSHFLVVVARTSLVAIYYTCYDIPPGIFIQRPDSISFEIRTKNDLGQNRMTITILFSLSYIRLTIILFSSYVISRYPTLDRRNFIQCDVPSGSTDEVTICSCFRKRSLAKNCHGD